MNRTLSNIITGAIGAFTIGPAKTTIALQAINLVIDRFQEKFHRQKSEDETMRLCDWCAEFVESQHRIPTIEEIDHMLDICIVR